MSAVPRLEHDREQAGRALVEAGVNTRFVAELDDEVVEELLERITHLLRMHKEYIQS